MRRIQAEGQVDPRWGRADCVAVASVVDGEIADWQEFTVGWGTLHDEGTKGAHHARVARFLRDNQVQAIAVGHVGPGMQRMLGSMAIRVVNGLGGDARSAASGRVTANWARQCSAARAIMSGNTRPHLPLIAQGMLLHPAAASRTRCTPRYVRAWRLPPEVLSQFGG